MLAAPIPAVYLFPLLLYGRCVVPDPRLCYNTEAKEGGTPVKIRIAENVKALRRQHGFTQEQLAEALGVTVGAVYKWESGQSTPEVKLLVEMADLFEVSVDTLLGYDRQAENAERRVRQLEQHLTRREFDEALAEAEKALKKYPHHFDVVITAAAAYMLACIENDDHAAMERSIILFQRAIPLLYQCSDERVCEASIMSTIASMYIIDGQTGKGLETLRRHNVCGTNNAAIGFTLAMRREAGEAKPFLYDAYASLLNDALYTGLGLILMYGTLRDEQYREAGTWLFRFLDSIELPSERVTYIDKIRAVLHAQLALICAECGSTEEADAHIRDAHRLAMRFDHAPDYEPTNLRFFQSADLPLILTDGLGNTADDAINRFVFSRAPASPALDAVRSRYDELCQADS